MVGSAKGEDSWKKSIVPGDRAFRVSKIIAQIHKHALGNYNKNRKSKMI